MPQHYAANRCTLRFKGNRWFHGTFSKVDIQLGHISALISTHSELSFHRCKDACANAVSAKKLRMRATANKHHNSMVSYFFEFVDQQKISPNVALSVPHPVAS